MKNKRSGYYRYMYKIVSQKTKGVSFYLVFAEAQTVNLSFVLTT